MAGVEPARMTTYEVVAEPLSLILSSLKHKTFLRAYA